MACGPHSITWPASTAPASWSKSSRRQPCHHAAGPVDERGVGDPRADHDVGAGVERRGNPPAAEVGVRGDRLAPGAAQWLAGIQVGQRLPVREQLAESREQVIAGDVGDLGVQAEALGERPELPGQARGVEAAGVVDDLDPAIEAGAEHVLQLGQHRAGVARGRVLLLGLPQDQHGQLGQVVAGKDVDRTALDHLPGRGGAVAVEAGGVGDPDRAARSGWPGLAGLGWPVLGWPVGLAVWAAVMLAPLPAARPPGPGHALRGGRGPARPPRRRPARWRSTDRRSGR